MPLDPWSLPDDEFMQLVWAAYKRAAAGGGGGLQCAGINVIEQLGRELGDTATYPDVRARVARTLSQLALRGFIAPGPNALDNVGLASTKETLALDPVEVTYGWPREANLVQKFPEVRELDEVLAAYFFLAARCFEARTVDDAALFFIGAAAERMLDVVAERIGHLIDRKRWLPLKSTEKVETLARILEEAGTAQSKPDLRGDAEVVRTIGHAMRVARNDAGHPREKPPTFSRSMVAARICEFPDYAKRLLAAAENTK